VEFALGNQEVILDYKTYFYYLELACLKYVNEFPNYKQVIEKYLSLIIEKYNL
jgi:hypothetical protein